MKLWNDVGPLCGILLGPAPKVVEWREPGWQGSTDLGTIVDDVGISNLIRVALWCCFGGVVLLVLKWVCWCVRFCERAELLERLGGGGTLFLLFNVEKLFLSCRTKTAATRVH